MKCPWPALTIAALLACSQPEATTSQARPATAGDCMPASPPAAALRLYARGPLGLDPSARPITETWSGGGHCSAA